MKQSYDSIDDFLNFLGVVNTDANKNYKQSSWKDTEYGFMKAFDTHGISPENIDVDIKDGILNIHGENSCNDIKYHVDYKDKVPCIDLVDNISFESKNGVTYIYIKLKAPEENSIKISRI